ncbi:Xyloglucan galactosyltransferase MUR3, partial [Mucuna pruriens]
MECQVYEMLVTLRFLILTSTLQKMIIESATISKVGKLLECDFGESKYHSPKNMMQLFQGDKICF